MECGGGVMWDVMLEDVVAPLQAELEAVEEDWFGMDEHKYQCRIFGFNWESNQIMHFNSKNNSIARSIKYKW